MSDGITITRHFAATPEQVFSMWTTPAHFSVWWGGETVDVPLDSIAMDVRVGGRWKADMHLPDGNVINWAGEYTEVDPPSRLALTLTDVPSEPAGDPVTVDIHAVDGGSEMTMHQADHGFTEEQLRMTIAGYQTFFDVMEKVLADQR